MPSNGPDGTAEASGPTDRAGRSVSTRWPEIGVAVLLQVLALFAVTDSLRIGVGWADDGPRSGYFPFGIGLVLFMASTWILVGQLRRMRRPQPVFAERRQLRQVVSVLAPMAIYVALIVPLGLYLASGGLIAWFMRRHGRYGAIASAMVAIAVPLFLFLVFERWFLVLLPKGPLEQWFGL